MHQESGLFCDLRKVCRRHTKFLRREAIEAKPERIMLDNMDANMLRQAVDITAGRIPLEATGGVTLNNIRGVAASGVQYISIGALTHSAVAADIGADIVLESH